MKAPCSLVGQVVRFFWILWLGLLLLSTPAVGLARSLTATPAAAVPGDVTGDGKVDAIDVVAVINHFLGVQTRPAADVTGDGSVNALDVVFVINRVLGIVPTGGNQALLGPLAGATIHAYRLGNLNTAMEGPIQANAGLTDPALAGTFQLTLAGIPNDEWVLVTATGGQDLDANDDGVLDATPTPNQGVLHALAKAADWRRGGLRINVLTEIAWQELAEEIASGQIDDLDGRLRWIANNLFEGDVTGDGDLDYQDLVAFDPRSEVFRKSLVFPFAAFLAEDDAGRSLFDEIHDGQEQAVRDWIAAFFGDRLQAPRAPEIVDVVTEVQLPANREGLRGPDLLISSAVSSSAQILDQGATLMIAKDAAGHPVLLAFALPGEVARFSPRSTALALVMLTLGGPRNADAFIDLAGRVTAQQGFDPLVVAIENTLGADPFFLDRLMTYVDLVNQVKSVVAAVKASIAIAPTAAPMAFSRQMVLAAEPSLPIAKDSFYCFWPYRELTCSPWHKSQPWDWYGDAKGVEALWPDDWTDAAFIAVLGTKTGGTGAVAYLLADAYAELLPDFTHVPFLAVPQENQTEIGLANPGAANYAFELLAGDGSVSDWFLTPRNSSLFDKLLNSGAARRSLYSVANDAHRRSLSAANSWVRFNRRPDWSTPQGKAVIILNTAHGAISLLNVVHDFSAASETLQEIAKNERAVSLLGTCVGVDNVFFTLLSLEDLAWDTTSNRSLRQAGSLLVDAAFEGFLSIAESLVSAEGMLCIGKAAKLVNREWSKWFGQQVVASSIDALGTLVGVKIFIDTVNDTIPTFLSILWPWSEQQDYYLTWGRDVFNNPILIDVSTTPTQGPIAPPKALFTTEQRAGEGLTVHFDASGSRLDFRATPSFTWDFGDGATGSGELTSHTYEATGVRQVRLTVSDGLGQTAERTATVHVRNGVPPVIESMSCRLDPNDARRVLIDAQVTDGDGDLAELEWWREPLAFQILPDQITAPDVTQVALSYPDDGITAFAPTLRARDAAGNVSVRTCTVFPSGVVTSPLNDTGITRCGDATRNDLPCPVSGFPGQDAESGRDVTHNDDSDGHAGFSFTKLDGNGNPLSASATSWTCVRDNVTGLIWEVKTDDGGLRDKDNTYTWYNPDSSSNGGNAGAQNGGNCVGSACDTYAYVQAVNAQGLCGAMDWRLPTRFELESITSNDRTYPAIDTAFFPDIASWGFWSSSPEANNPDGAWYVTFDYGYVGDSNKDYAGYVLLVRGGQ